MPAPTGPSPGWTARGSCSATGTTPTADKAFLMKQAVKTIAARQGRTATFMAKPHETWSGNSGHLHLSLWSASSDENLLASGPPNALTELASQAVAGMLETMPAATPFFCPNPNSY